jgi:hypothetical protein
VTAYTYAPDDRFGVPGNVLKLPDDFYGALGRVAAVGALVELNVSYIVVLWGNDQADAGRLMSHLSKRFKAIERARMAARLEMPDALVRAMAAAESAMHKRNEVLHSLWPQEDFGWRSRPEGAVLTEPVGIDALCAVIAELVAALDGLREHVRSPVEGPGSGQALGGARIG